MEHLVGVPSKATKSGREKKKLIMKYNTSHHRWVVEARKLSEKGTRMGVHTTDC